MVLFVGDVASETRDREAFQEVDFCSFFGPSTKGMAKRVERIDDAARIPEYVAPRLPRVRQPRAELLREPFDAAAHASMLNGEPDAR